MTQSTVSQHRRTMVS